MSDLREALRNLVALVSTDRNYDDSESLREARNILFEANKAALSAQPQPEAALADWRDDPTSDERWSAGLDFAMIQLCAVMGVDPHDVTWDAATEEVEGDVRAVIWNILRAKMGEDWKPEAPPIATDEWMRRALERELTDCQSAVDTIEHHRDTSNETQNGNYRFYQGRVVSLKFALEALSGVDDASNASAVARLRSALEPFAKIKPFEIAFSKLGKIYRLDYNASFEDQLAFRHFQAARNALSAGGGEATKSEGGINWTPFEDGTAPWSEDEQFEEAAKACKSRCKKFGKGTCDGAFEGNCTECERDAEIVLRRKYLKPSCPSDPTAAEREAIARHANEINTIALGGWSNHHDQDFGTKDDEYKLDCIREHADAILAVSTRAGG